MKTDMKKQTGLTLMGVMFIVAFIAIVVLFTVRAFPLYNEKFQVVAAMNSVAGKADESTTTAQIRKNFQQNITASSNIRKFNDNAYTKEAVNVIKPKKKGDPRMLHVKYELTNQLVDDLQLLMVFDRSVPLGRPTGG